MPEWTDHLLLVVMQLPHHHWSPRLAVDIGRIVFHRVDQIDWDALAIRARAWGMRSVSGAALYLAASLLDVPLPATAQAFAQPENYVQRVQWNMAKQALADQFTRPYSRVAPLAAYLLVDRIDKIPKLVFRRVMRGPGMNNGQDTVLNVARRIIHGAMVLPAMGRIMISSLLARHSPGRLRQSGG